MADDKDFLNFLGDSSLDLSKEELEKIIDEELGKSETEMDPDLIEYCLDAIANGQYGSSHPENEIKEEMPKKRRSFIFGKVILGFAAAALVFSCLMSATADDFDESVLGGALHLFSDRIEIDLTGEDCTAIQYNFEDTELAKELRFNGIRNVVLPEVLVNGDYGDYTLEFNRDLLSDAVRIVFKKGRAEISVEIVQHRDDSKQLGGTLPGAGGKLCCFETNGIKVYVFEQDDESWIVYCDGKSEYKIHLPCNYEKACEIAHTIK